MTRAATTPALRDRDERESVMTRLRQVDLTLERRKEKQALYGWLDTCFHNHGQVLLIQGPSGVGKAQLLKKAVRRSGSRNLLLITTDARSATGPFGIFRAWIDGVRRADLPASLAQELSAFVQTRRLLSLLTGLTNDLPTEPGWRLPSPERGTERRDQLTAELVRFFSTVARQRPLSLAVANYDALDLETRDLLDRVFTGLTACPVGLILTVADDHDAPIAIEGDGRDILAQRRHKGDATGKIDVTTLRMGPTTLPQAQGLVRQVCKRHRLSDAFISRLIDHTDGNPSRLLLTLWHLIETRILICAKQGWSAPSGVRWSSLPEDLHREVAERLVLLSSDAAALLKGMAIAERRLTLRSLLGLLGWDRQRFVEVRNDVNRVFPVFKGTNTDVESLLSRTVLEAIRTGCTSELETKSWHHRIAGYLADADVPTLHEEIAESYEAAGSAESALTYRIAAAHRARSITAYDRAVRNLELALANCAPQSALHARLLIRTADIQGLRGDRSGARASAAEAIRIAKRSGSLRLEADAKYFLAGLETSGGSLAEGLVLLDQSLALYRAAGRSDGRLAVLGRMATVYRELRMWPQSDAINEELLTLAESENNPTRTATSRINAAISAAVRGDRTGAAEYLYRALRICRKHGHWDLITLALIDFADAVGEGCGPADLDRYYLAAVASARRRFDEIRELEAMHKLAASYLGTRSFRQAGAAADQVIRLAGMRGADRFRADATRIAAVSAWKRGNDDLAQRHFETALRIAEAEKNELIKARTLADRGDCIAARAPNDAEAAWREARNIFSRLGVRDEVLRLDRTLIRHTYEHASQPARYSQAV